MPAIRAPIFLILKTDRDNSSKLGRLRRQEWSRCSRRQGIAPPRRLPRPGGLRAALELPPLRSAILVLKECKLRGVTAANRGHDDGTG